MSACDYCPVSVVMGYYGGIEHSFVTMSEALHLVIRGPSSLQMANGGLAVDLPDRDRRFVGIADLE